MLDRPDGATDGRSPEEQDTKDEMASAAAWTLVREKGLAGLAMRDLGKRVGMKAQSILSFEAKNDIYDAMFREALWTSLLPS